MIDILLIDDTEADFDELKKIVESIMEKSGFKYWICLNYFDNMKLIANFIQFQKEKNYIKAVSYPKINTTSCLWKVWQT